MIETLEARILADWQSLFPGEGVPESLRGFVLSTSRQPTGTRIIFFFGKGESGPRLVARIPRRPDRLEALEREWLRLGLLWNQAGEPLRQTLPRPLAAWKVLGLPVYLQQALPGASQKTLIQRGGGWVER